MQFTTMQFTLKQLLSNPSDAGLLTAKGLLRLKTDLEHFLNNEHVLTDRIQECQTLIKSNPQSNVEVIYLQEIIQHQTTIRQLRSLYGYICNLQA